MKQVPESSTLELAPACPSSLVLAARYLNVLSRTFGQNFLQSYMKYTVSCRDVRHYSIPDKCDEGNAKLETRD